MNLYQMKKVKFDNEVKIIHIECNNKNTIQHFRNFLLYDTLHTQVISLINTHSNNKILNVGEEISLKVSNPNEKDWYEDDAILFLINKMYDTKFFSEFMKEYDFQAMIHIPPMCSGSMEYTSKLCNFLIRISMVVRLY